MQETEIPRGAQPGVIEIFGRNFCGISHPGGRRGNEDAVLALDHNGAVLLAVADGLGGQEAGEVASALAVKTLKEGFISSYGHSCSIDEAVLLLRRLFVCADRAVKSNHEEGCRGMATTLVAALVLDDAAVICNTGDSQAMLVGTGKRFSSREHSLVAGLIGNGTITPEEARTHPLRHIITHAVGGDFAVDHYVLELHPGDMLILSSDGLHDFVRDETVMQAASLQDSALAVNMLLSEALPVTTDNASLVVYIHTAQRRRINAASARVDTKETEGP